MDYKTMAAKILENVGGKENVSSVVHCATRLRFTLKDAANAKTEVVKKIPGVLSVVNAGGQYQIVIGPDVPQVYQEIISIGGFDAAAPIDDPEAAKADKRSRLSKILEGIASIFQPIIPAITGAGLLKAIIALLSVIGVLKSGTQTHTILNAMADAAFYFLPVTKATYTSSVIPIILGVWFMSYVEKFMQKISPKAIKFFSSSISFTSRLSKLHVDSMQT